MILKTCFIGLLLVFSAFGSGTDADVPSDIKAHPVGGAFSEKTTTLTYDQLTQVGCRYLCLLIDIGNDQKPFPLDDFLNLIDLSCEKFENTRLIAKGRDAVKEQVLGVRANKGTWTIYAQGAPRVDEKKQEVILDFTFSSPTLNLHETMVRLSVTPMEQINKIKEVCALVGNQDVLSHS